MHRRSADPKRENVRRSNAPADILSFQTAGKVLTDFPGRAASGFTADACGPLVPPHHKNT